MIPVKQHRAKRTRNHSARRTARRMRLARFTFEEIGHELGVSWQRARMLTLPMECEMDTGITEKCDRCKRAETTLLCINNNVKKLRLLCPGCFDLERKLAVYNSKPR